MEPVKEVYGYVVRYIEGKPHVLALRVSSNPSYLQFPKSVVREQEDTYTQVIKEVKNKTGIDHFDRTLFITDDLWRSESGRVYHRFFYKLLAFEEKGEDFASGYWINSAEASMFSDGHGDYLFRIL